MHDFSEINPHLALLQSESYVSPREREWDRWVAKVEKLLGHDLDGNQATDGYSLGFASDHFDAGDTPEQYVEVVRDDQAKIAAVIDEPPSKCNGGCRGKRNAEQWNDEGFCNFCGEDGNG